MDGKAIPVPEHAAMVTAPEAATSGKVRIAFGSCFHRWGLGNRNQADLIRSRAPSALLLLGDVAVEDRKNHLGLHRADCLLRDLMPAWQDLVAAVPVYATWDDHDYFSNDKAGIPKGYSDKDKAGVCDVFKQAWNNPSYGFNDERRGVFLRTRVGPCDVIMVDNRYFRENREGSFLGDEQMQWPEEQLLDCDGARGFRIPRPSGFSPYEFEAASLGGRSGPAATSAKWDTQLYGISGQYPAPTGIYHVLGGRLPRAYSPNFTHINPFYRYRLPLTEMTIPKELKKAGYVTGHVGKWHLGRRSNGYPFPGKYGFEMGYVDDLGTGGTYYPDPDIWGPRDQLRDQHNGLAQLMKPDRLTGWATKDPNDPFQLDEDGRPFDKTLDVALKWLEKHHAKPFLLNYCTYYVHGPIQTRNREQFAYYCEKMGYAFPTDPGVINAGRGGKTNPYYATMVETLDWMIGKVVAYLETTDDPRNPGHKLIENTYIIISSDNGGLVRRSGGTVTDNSPLREGKQDIHEGGVRIPFIVRGPNVPKDSVCETPISLIDLYPTFVDLAGLPPSDNTKLDGCNIRPLMEGKESVARFADGTERESIYFYYPIELSAGCAMRKGPWKIYRNLGPGNNKSPLVELFRLYNDDGSMADVGEQENLSKALGRAESLYAAGDGTDDQYYAAIRGLRNSIRNLKGTATQADNYYLNMFRQGGPF